MIDFHTHILPEMDDGSRSPEESVRMLREEIKQGISDVVLTPHYYAERETPQNFLLRRAEACEKLYNAMTTSPEGEQLPRLFIGAEVRMFSGISNMELLPELSVRGTDYILLEMPFEPWPESVFRELREIGARGLSPVIAHLEAYRRLQKGTDNMERLMDSGVLIQCNAEFFLQGFKSRKAFQLLKEGRIQLLGSDCHNMTSRPPNLGKALKVIEKKMGEDVAAAFIHQSSKVFTVRQKNF